MKELSRTELIRFYYHFNSYTSGSVGTDTKHYIGCAIKDMRELAPNEAEIIFYSIRVYNWLEYILSKLKIDIDFGVDRDRSVELYARAYKFRNLVVPYLKEML